MTKKKSSSARSRSGSNKLRTGKTSSRVRPEAALGRASRFALPLAISAVLILGLAFLGFTFYQNATASDFFNVRSVDIRGNDRTPAEDIRRIVGTEVERPGVWNVDLASIKLKIEKFPFVKTAAVSRVLPAGIRVDVIERVPEAMVRLSAGNYLVDGEGVVLAPAQSGDKGFPFAMQGWDEGKTERSGPDNIARVKLYKKMVDEWKQFDLVSRVREVNLTNLREPVAVVSDSGRLISISLSKENLGKSLRTAIEAVTGKGGKIKSVNAEGLSPVITYLDLGNEQ